MNTAVLAMPDLVGRDDRPSGVWDVAEAVGFPSLDLDRREMRALAGDDAAERWARAEQVMRAKVSPQGEDLARWVARGRAPLAALVAAETFRVRVLLDRAGFTAVPAGDEKALGARLAGAQKWAEAVYATAVLAATPGLRAFLSGVRSAQPAWVAPLRALAAKLTKTAKRVPAERLGSTEMALGGIRPAGFAHSEAWAALLGRLGGLPAPRAGSAVPSAAEEGQGGEEQRSAQPGPVDGSPDEDPAPVSEAEIKAAQPLVDVKASWDEVRREEVALVDAAPGGLGRRRRPADRGRAPRRVHRLLVDPQRRVFDVTRRGTGGVVLIDGSGSMRLTREMVLDIVRAAPGCTVAVYASSGRLSEANLQVLAEGGRMCAEIPQRATGNGVDYPAARWAVGQRQHTRAPVVWITDGYVMPLFHSFSERAAAECAEYAVAERIIVRPTAEEGIAVLRALAAGAGSVPQGLPVLWADCYRRVTGRALGQRQVR